MQPLEYIKKIVDMISLSGKTRNLSGLSERAVFAFSVVIALYHFYFFIFGTFYISAYENRIIHFGLILALSFLTYSLSGRSTKTPFIDYILAGLALLITGYLIVNYEWLFEGRMSLEPGSLKPFELAMGVVLILMLFEAARRAIGNWLGLVVLVALIYARIGASLGGLWYNPGFTFEQIIDFTVFTTGGIFTTPLGVAATYIILFLIFGAFVMKSGANVFFTRLAHAIVGDAYGGAAKISLISSGLIGSITGSATANVAITGVVTIPMMKKTGFQPHVAGAVEAAASKGGHILPPVMAGIVFLMSEFSGISYFRICLASAVPALLYYLAVGIQIHCYSKKRGIKGLGVQKESIGQVLRSGWQYFLPFISLVGMLAYGYSPIWAALYSIPVIIAASWFRKETRMGIPHILKALNYAVMSMRLVTLAVALAGILIGVLFHTGLGTSINGFIRSMAGSHLFFILLLAALFCLMLGLTCTIIAAYILTAVLVVPAVMQLGIPPLASHLFAVYLASTGTITPPMGTTFFVAAGIAEAPAFKTGWAAVRLAFAAFVIPFFFVYHPALLLIGNAISVPLTIMLAVIIVFTIAIALEGWFYGPLAPWQRALFILAGVLMVSVSFISITIGLGLFCVAVSVQILRKRAPAKASVIDGQ